MTAVVESSFGWLTVSDAGSRSRVAARAAVANGAPAMVGPEPELLVDAYLGRPRPLFTRLPISYRSIPGPVRALLLGAEDRVAQRAAVDGRFPAWPIEARLDEARAARWAAAAASEAVDLCAPRWPGGRRAALLLTHDVDSRAELRLVPHLRAAERAHGMPSAFGVVPELSWPDEAMVAELVAEDCEVYCHDLRHDGRLPYLGSARIGAEIDAVFERHPWARLMVQGFRSGQLLMSADLLGALAGRFSYDLSMPDTERTGPYGGVVGCGTVFPFAIGPLLEIPLTLPQDFYLRHVYRFGAAHLLAVWRAKLDHIRRLGGVAVLNVHPVWVNPGETAMWDVYHRLLDEVTGDGDWWVTVPTRLASWLAELRAGRSPRSSKAADR